MKITVHTEANAEDNAALQAWYSRSNKGVDEHLQKLSKEGSGKFMDQIFIQYGHASVGDLGFATVYLEGISMLAAKAIEDTPLFNGQECSSRYIDFGSVEFKQGRPDSIAEKDLQERMRSFYINGLPVVREHVSQQFPREDGQSESTYAKAVAAKSFDIMRGFLPCGATTSVAWTGSLRTLRGRLELLTHHPLEEVSSLAWNTYAKLYEKYPHSFVEGYATHGYSKESLLTLGVETEDVFNHLSDLEQFYSYLGTTSTSSLHVLGIPELPHLRSYLGEDYVSVKEYTKHPKGYAPTAHSWSNILRVDATGELDFGSFRDLQRHRNGYCSMPIVDSYLGLHTWYFSSLPESLKNEAISILNEVRSLDVSGNQTKLERIQNQYFMPMGMLAPFELSYSVKQAIYVSELRSGQTVHPTLRVLAKQLVEHLVSQGCVVHADLRGDKWSLRRGNQDIVERASTFSSPLV